MEFKTHTFAMKVLVPIDSPDFATLTPHFKNAGSELIKSALGMVFPNIPSSLGLIGKFAIASLVFHHDYLKKNLMSS